MANTLLNERFGSKKIIRIDADRNITPEVAIKESIVQSDGNGATNLVRQYINKSNLNGKLVEVDLLNYLNKIMEPDFIFLDILCQEIDDEEVPQWEIFLEEENKGRIALSDSGSGLRTILLLLINLILVPDIKGLAQSEIIYIFEELENNLHPLIQKNLYIFLSDWIKKNNSMCFLTTHSNIPLNMFVKDQDSQILHVYKADDGETLVKTVFSEIDNNSVLDDIGVQASDIMQSNCIIWVEGPSDRIYINKWIDLASEGSIKENIHYQILFYGGRLLSHLSATEGDEFVNLLKANRHSIIVMDSDKKNKQAKINDTKKRIISEFEDAESIAWVTKGREIENYLPSRILEKYFDLEKIDFNQYEKIEDKLNISGEKDKKKYGVSYGRNKVFYAKELTKSMTVEDLDHYDLKMMMERIVKKIESWN